MKVIFKNTSLTFQSLVPPSPRKAIVEVGSINGQTGEDLERTNRLRTDGYFEVTEFPIVIKASSSTYQNAVVSQIVVYNSSKAWKGYAVTKNNNVNNTLTWASNANLDQGGKISVGDYIRIVLSNSPEGSVDPALGSIEIYNEYASGILFDNTNSVKISS